MLVHENTIRVIVTLKSFFQRKNRAVKFHQLEEVSKQCRI